MQPSRQRSSRQSSHERNERRGRIAETLATWLLRLKGYRIIGRRVKTVAGEIDLIARRDPRRGRTLVIVEVKLRTTHDAALHSVTRSQRTRLQRAAEIYVAQKMPCSNVGIRFDVITVVPWSRPRHLVDAWRPE